MQVRMSAEGFARMITDSFSEEGQVVLDVPVGDRQAFENSRENAYLGIELRGRYQFWFEGRYYSLSETQYLVLELLIAGRGQTTFADLGERIWGDSCYPDVKIRDAVRKLRNKLKALGTPLTATTKAGIAFLSRLAT